MPSITRSARRGHRPNRHAIEDALSGAIERLVGEGRRFTEVSVEQLASAAGISRSTFYVYFRDKGDLVHGLSTRVGDELVGALERWRGVAGQASISDLRGAVVAIMEVYQRHSAVLAALAETATYDAEVAAVFRGTMAQMTLAGEQSIDLVRAAGRTHPDLPEGLAEVLTFAVERSCYLFAHAADDVRRAQLADALTHVVWNAIYAPGGR